MAELEKLGFKPYGRAYPHDDLVKIRAEFEEGKEVSAAGRLLMIRRMGERRHGQVPAHLQARRTG